MKNDIAIELTNVSKRYHLHSSKPTLMGNLNPFKKRKEFWALKNINLTIRKGERIGIIGKNGSGKTTLLKIIAGITKPSTGTIETNGKIVSLIELTAGFIQELHGIENIYLNGMILGMTKSQIKSNINKIINLANIGDYIHQPLYTYSAGMKFRLAFSIAAYSESNIYLIDEIFGNSDLQFQQVIADTLTKLQKNGATFIICSHIPVFIWKLSSRFLTTNNGKIERITKIAFKQLMHQNEREWKASIKPPPKRALRFQ